MVHLYIFLYVVHVFFWSWTETLFGFFPYSCIKSPVSLLRFRINSWSCKQLHWRVALFCFILELLQEVPVMSLTDEETPTPICIMLLFFCFFPPKKTLYMVILLLTLKECCLLVFYEAMMALALILIDGGTAHLLKAAYICLPGLYICTNGNCFVLPVLGMLPWRLWGRAATILLLSTQKWTKWHGHNQSIYLWNQKGLHIKHSRGYDWNVSI